MDKIIKIQALWRGYKCRKTIKTLLQATDLQLLKIIGDLKPTRKKVVQKRTKETLLKSKKELESKIFCILDMINHRKVMLQSTV
jgi:hypothetical protein